jgi:hypothetical protein
MIKMYEQFEPNYEDYVIGLPSGEIIDMLHRQVTKLMKLGFIHWNSKYCHYTYRDGDKQEIMRYSQDKEEDYTKFVNPSYIGKFLEKLGIKKDQWKLNEDNEVDLMTRFTMNGIEAEVIPFKFGICYFDFDCSNNLLISLDNSPKIVQGNFNCSNNSLKNLKGGPTRVTGNYNCSDNMLTSLEGSPRSVGKSFNCSGNSLTTLIGSPDRVGETMNCSDNLLKDFRGKPICRGFIYKENPIDLEK